MCENLYSVEKLIEFGVGFAMAQQVIKVMNETMNMPNDPRDNFVTQQASTIYVSMNGRAVGPISESDFTSLVSKHEITKETLVWTPGMTSWEPIKQVSHILKIIALTSYF